MSSNVEVQSNTDNTSTFGQILWRLLTSAVILAITAFFTPGFQISNFWSLAVAAVVLTIIDYLVSKFTGIQASPFGKGFVGFVLSVIVLYVTQYFVAGYSISWMSAIIGAIIYGIVDYFLPGEQKM